jgi:hypothetical protein
MFEGGAHLPGDGEGLMDGFWSAVMERFACHQFHHDERQNLPALALPPGPAGPRQGGHGRGATAGEPAEGACPPWPCPLALPGHGRGATAGEPAEGSPVRDASQPHAGPVLSTRYARDAAQTVRQAHHGGLSKESVRGRQVTGGSTAMARKRHP